MKFVIDVVDPRDLRVVCLEAIWTNKILKKRPWMDGWEGIVAKAIEEPSLPICRAANNENRHIYYRLMGKGKPRYIKVIVDFNKEHLGSIISAYPVDSGKTGEQAIWP